MGRTVHHRRFHQLIRHLVNKLLHKEQPHRHGHQRKNVRQIGIHDPQPVYDQISWNGYRYRHKHQGNGVDLKQLVLSAKLQFRQGKAGHGTDDNGQKHNDNGNHNAVEQIPPHGDP